MDHVLNWLWQGSAIALATFAALRLLDRSRAPFRYVLCGIALLAVLALPVVSLLWNRTPAWEAIADTPMPTTPVLAIPIAWWTSGAVIAGLWALWCLICVGRVIASSVAVRRARRQSRPFPAALESRLTFWNEVRGRGRRTRLVVSSGVPAAAVLGWGSPVIAVAPAFVRRLGDEEIDRAVIHEWAHVQRYDDLLNLLQIARAGSGRMAPGGLVARASAPDRAGGGVRRDGRVADRQSQTLRGQPHRHGDAAAGSTSPGVGGRSVFVAHAEDTHPADSVDEYAGDREVVRDPRRRGRRRARRIRARSHACAARRARDAATGGGRRSTAASSRPPDAVGRLGRGSRAVS